MNTGDGALLNRFTSELAHAIAGCAVGAGRASAAGGAAGDGCAAGAVGAVAGHLFAQFVGEGLPLDQTVQFSRLIGGVAAAIAGGDERSISIGATAGENAAENNFGYLLTLVPRVAVPIGDRNAIDTGLSSAMGTQPIPERATNSSNEISRYPNGNWADANRAFDAMPLSGVRVVGTTPIGDIRYGTLPDGTAVIVRPISSDGAPTIQIQDSNRPSGRPVTVQEIRFGPPRQR